MTTTIATANHQVTRSTTNASSYTLGSYAVGSGSDRVLAVIVSLLRSNENGIVPVGVTFGGVALTEADRSVGLSTSRYNYVGIFYLVNPSVSTADIVVTPPASMAGCIISAITLYGVHQTYPTGRSTRVKVAAGSELDILVGLAATSGLCLLAVSSNAGNNPTWTWGSGLSELYDVNNGSNDTNEIAGSAILRDSDAGGATVTCSTSPAMMVGVGVEFLPAGLSVTQQTISVAASNDDAGQTSGGSMFLNSTSGNVNNSGDLYFGMRFLGLNAPNSALILSAFVRPSVASTTYDTPFFTLQTEANDEPATFGSSSNNISSRSLSGDSVTWDEVNIGAGYQRSPNIFLPVQYVCALGGWTAGDDIVIVMTNAGAAGTFRFNTYDYSSGSEAPQLIVTWLTGGTTYTATPAGILTSGGAVAKAGRKPLAGATSPAGALIRRGGKALAGVMTSAGALARAGRKAVAGSLSSAGSLAAGRRLARALAGALSSSGGLLRRAGKPLAGSLSPAGALASVRSYLRALGGALGSSGGLARSARKALSGQMSTGGALATARVYLRTLAGALTGAGGLARSIGKNPGGSLSPAGVVAAARTVLKSLSGALSSAGGLARMAGKSLGGSLSAAGAMTRLGTFGRALGGVLSPAGNVARRTAKTMSGGLSFAGAVGLIKTFLKSLAGALSSAGSLSRSVGKPLAGGLSPAGNLARAMMRALAGALTFAGGLARRTGRALGGVVSAGGDLSRRAGKTLGGAVASSGGLARRIGKALDGGLSPVGSVGSAFGKMLGGAVGLAGDVSRATGKTLAGALALIGELVIVSLPGGLVAGLVHLTAAARSFALTARERVFNLTVRNR